MRLPENTNIGFMADTKGNAFEAPYENFRPLLAIPNPKAHSNFDVIRPWYAGKDVSQRCRGLWIIDFGTELSEGEAALYEAPFEYVRRHIFPERMKNRRQSYRRYWWRHVEPRPAMRAALKGKSRILTTAITSVHRLFAWLNPEVIPDHKLIAFARDDDYFFGVLHGSIHELWRERRERRFGMSNLASLTFRQ